MRPEADFVLSGCKIRVECNLVSDLFSPQPTQWGLRGDPYLWKEMRESFVGVVCPGTTEKLAALLGSKFEDLTGYPISHEEDFGIERFSHGGMSSGMISAEFWRLSAIPLLCTRMIHDRSLKLMDLIQLSGISLNDFKIHCATGVTSSPLEAFFDGTFRQWQEGQNKKNFECAQILSLIHLGGTRWLFGGIFDVLGVKVGATHNANGYTYSTKGVFGKSCG